MFTPFTKRLLEALDACLIDNGNGTFTIRTETRVISGTSNSPKTIHKVSTGRDYSNKLFNKSSAAFTMYVR